MSEDWSWHLICDESLPLKLRRLFIHSLKESSLQYLNRLITTLTVVNYRLLDRKQQAFVKKLELLLRKPEKNLESTRKFLARGIGKLIVFLKHARNPDTDNGRGGPSAVS
jgi:hypothetical protein